MTNRGGFAMSGITIIAALVVVVVIVGIIGFYGRWFGSEQPYSASAPATTEQGGIQQQPSSSQQ